MPSISENTIPLEIIANVIDRISSVGPFRVSDAKSTFYVPPRLHRKLDLICECTGLTRQEIYTKALRKYLHDGYGDDLDPKLLSTTLIQ